MGGALLGAASGRAGGGLGAAGGGGDDGRWWFGCLTGSIVHGKKSSHPTGPPLHWKSEQEPCSQAVLPGQGSNAVNFLHVPPLHTASTQSWKSAQMTSGYTGVLWCWHLPKSKPLQPGSWQQRSSVHTLPSSQALALTLPPRHRPPWHVAPCKQGLLAAQGLPSAHNAPTHWPETSHTPPPGLAQGPANAHGLSIRIALLQVPSARQTPVPKQGLTLLVVQNWPMTTGAGTQWPWPSQLPPSQALSQTLPFLVSGATQAPVTEQTPFSWQGCPESHAEPTVTVAAHARSAVHAKVTQGETLPQVLPTSATTLHAPWLSHTPLPHTSLTGQLAPGSLACTHAPELVQTLCLQIASVDPHVLPTSILPTQWPVTSQVPPTKQGSVGVQASPKPTLASHKPLAVHTPRPQALSGSAHLAPPKLTSSQAPFA
jgi:hypothetical protein